VPLVKDTKELIALFLLLSYPKVNTAFPSLPALLNAMNTN